MFSHLPRALRLLRPITLDDESQVRWQEDDGDGGGEGGGCRRRRWGYDVPVVIALHARWGERAQELTRSTSLHIVIGSVIRHFEDLLQESPTRLLSLSEPPSLLVSCQLTALGCSHLPRKRLAV